MTQEVVVTLRKADTGKFFVVAITGSYSHGLLNAVIMAANHRYLLAQLHTKLSDLSFDMANQAQAILTMLDQLETVGTPANAQKD